jgi:hypothetical protein
MKLLEISIQVEYLWPWLFIKCFKPEACSQGITPNKSSQQCARHCSAQPAKYLLLYHLIYHPF